MNIKKPDWLGRRHKVNIQTNKKKRKILIIIEIYEKENKKIVLFIYKIHKVIFIKKIVLFLLITISPLFILVLESIG
jgi:hypothetical protein